MALQGERSLLIFVNVFCDAPERQLVACSIDRPHPPLSGSWLRGAFYDCLLCDLRWFLSAGVCQLPAAGVGLV